eukprot:791950-Amphidinium_carterae.2
MAKQNQQREPALFTITQCKESVSHEKHFLASARSIHAGARTVVAARMTRVFELMTEKRESGGKEPTDTNLRDYFAGMDSEQYKRLAQPCVLFCGISNKGELLFMPCGFVVCELIDKASDCFGLRVPMIFTQCQP